MSFYGLTTLRRLAAFWVDTLIMGAAIAIALMLVDWLLIPGKYPVGIYTPVILIFLAGPYFAHAELGRAHASLGQRLFSLTVTRGQLWRYLMGRLLPKMILTLLPFTAIYSVMFSLPNAPEQVQMANEQAAHETFMTVMSLNIFIWLIASLRFGQKHQSLLDLIADVQVSRH